MIKHKLFTSILSLCEKYEVESHMYHTGDTIIDNVSNHNLYIFVSGFYSVWSKSALGSIHQVGEVEAPSAVGEGIFFGSFKKPVRVITEKPGKVFILSEKKIASIAKENPHFYEILMRFCLSVASERIQEANTERTLGYVLIDALETQSFGNIPTLLTILKNTFSVTDVVWIERHEVLTDIFAIKYRESEGSTPVNEQIKLPGGKSKIPYILKDFSPGNYAHVYPLISRYECYGYLIFVSPDDHLPSYISRIIIDMIPNCIRIIESRWKNPNK